MRKTSIYLYSLFHKTSIKRKELKDLSFQLFIIVTLYNRRENTTNVKEMNVGVFFLSSITFKMSKYDLHHLKFYIMAMQIKSDLRDT